MKGVNADSFEGPLRLPLRPFNYVIRRRNECEFCLIEGFFQYEGISLIEASSPSRCHSESSTQKFDPSGEIVAGGCEDDPSLTDPGNFTGDCDCVWGFNEDVVFVSDNVTHVFLSLSLSIINLSILILILKI